MINQELVDGIARMYNLVAEIKSAEKRITDCKARINDFTKVSAMEQENINNMSAELDILLAKFQMNEVSLTEQPIPTAPSASEAIGREA